MYLATVCYELVLEVKRAFAAALRHRTGNAVSPAFIATPPTDPASLPPAHFNSAFDE